MKKVIIATALILSGCASTQEMIESRQEKMLTCVNKFMDRGTTDRNAYEICRRVYGSNKARREAFQHEEEQEENQ